ncbi:hypothetical protein CEUSTIGMA_g10470.t1 [Chlamydomonas eustigma]|uniref:Uncharacterized protein n=1 Tax=Chlamydomonas eustigma TaxID=1157962 RepID=A0A250XIZ0_9CHLO|nr:hypothetical protein CEUSTIGMA_g10470.t1 [Chlamydomonas eustigma]|eukprot:GAX83044.1 hypothetical protein CEUSTIGMA_g10470.t1 [Chlamydomonas eustigma]
MMGGIPERAQLEKSSKPTTQRVKGTRLYGPSVARGSLHEYISTQQPNNQYLQSNANASWFAGSTAQRYGQSKQCRSAPRQTVYEGWGYERQAGRRSASSESAHEASRWYDGQPVKRTGQFLDKIQSQQSFDAQASLSTSEATSDVTSRRSIHGVRTQIRVPGQLTFRVADKTYLKPNQRTELSRLLRSADKRVTRSGIPLRVYRYAIDDLRLYNALEASGVAGQVIVVDAVEDADVVLATRRKRTGKDVPLLKAQRTAENAGLPYFQLPTVSPLAVMEVLSPLLGLPEVPEHLLAPAQMAAARRLPKPDVVDDVIMRQHDAVLGASGRQPDASSGSKISSALEALLGGVGGRGTVEQMTAGQSGDVLVIQEADSISGLDLRSSSNTVSCSRQASIKIEENGQGTVGTSPHTVCHGDGTIRTPPDNFFDGIDAMENRQYMLPSNPYDRLGAGGKGRTSLILLRPVSRGIFKGLKMRRK